jgi:hypothetical protein
MNLFAFFRPRLMDTLKNYSAADVISDLGAGSAIGTISQQLENMINAAKSSAGSPGTAFNMRP